MKKFFYIIHPILSWIFGIVLFALGIWKWSYYFVLAIIAVTILLVVLLFVAIIFSEWIIRRIKQYDEDHKDEPGKWQSLRK